MSDLLILLTLTMVLLNGLTICECAICQGYLHALIRLFNRPHDGWLDMAKPFIAAFKSGATSVDSYITSDELIYWYRPTPKGVDCDATDTCMDPSASNSSGNYFIGRPNGWETMEDSVFVVSLLKADAQIVVNSGGNVQTVQAPAGANSFQVAMGVGEQTFSVTRNGQTVFEGTSLKRIINGCVCGLYNFNAYGSFSIFTCSILCI